MFNNYIMDFGPDLENELLKQRKIEAEISLILSKKKDKHENIKFILNEQNKTDVSEIGFYKGKIKELYSEVTELTEKNQHLVNSLKEKSMEVATKNENDLIMNEKNDNENTELKRIISELTSTIKTLKDENKKIREHEIQRYKKIQEEKQKNELIAKKEKEEKENIIKQEKLAREKAQKLVEDARKKSEEETRLRNERDKKLAIEREAREKLESEKRTKALQLARDKKIQREKEEQLQRDALEKIERETREKMENELRIKIENEIKEKMNFQSVSKPKPDVSELFSVNDNTALVEAKPVESEPKPVESEPKPVESEPKPVVKKPPKIRFVSAHEDMDKANNINPGGRNSAKKELRFNNKTTPPEPDTIDNSKAHYKKPKLRYI